jgi:hypothetical protein
VPTIRRVVTGHDSAGRGVVVADGPPPRVATDPARPGIARIDLWGTEPLPAVDRHGVDPTVTQREPPPEHGATRFVYVTLPPPAAAVAPDAAAPALGGEQLDPRQSGMHRTSSVDYILVIEGALDCELDGGETVKLNAGDALIQNGTLHRWRNPGPGATVFAAVMIGATMPADIDPCSVRTAND